MAMLNLEIPNYIVGSTASIAQQSFDCSMCDVVYFEVRTLVSAAFFSNLQFFMGVTDNPTMPPTTKMELVAVPSSGSGYDPANLATNGTLNILNPTTGAVQNAVLRLVTPPKRMRITYGFGSSGGGTPSVTVNVWGISTKS